MLFQKELDIPSNPFSPTSGAIEDSRFVYGRDKDIKYIFEWLNSYANVVIVGDRGVGKSSLLKAICQQAEIHLDKYREPIYFSLQDINSDDEFHKILCDIVGIEFCKGYKFHRDLSVVGRRLLLVVDEMEKFAQNTFSPRIQGYLKGWSDQANGPIKLVLASDVSLDKLFPQMSNMTSTLAGSCIEYRLNKWEEKTARGFINSRLDCSINTAIAFEEDEISKLINTSEGNPQKLMQLCHDLFREKADALDS